MISLFLPSELLAYPFSFFNKGQSLDGVLAGKAEGLSI